MLLRVHIFPRTTLAVKRVRAAYSRCAWNLVGDEWRCTGIRSLEYALVLPPDVGGHDLMDSASDRSDMKSVCPDLDILTLYTRCLLQVSVTPPPMYAHLTHLL